jgi:CRP-like cAMP-binding protein
MIPIDLFSHKSETVHVAAGEALFLEGQQGDRMFVLNTGVAEVFVKKQLVETLEHGSIVGEVGLVSPGPHSASVIAKTDCEFVGVDEKRFQFLVQQTPFFATRVMRIMAERLRAMDEKLA